MIQPDNGKPDALPMLSQCVQSGKVRPPSPANLAWGGVFSPLSGATQDRRVQPNLHDANSKKVFGMSRKRIPDHLKVLSGTARPDRMNPDAPSAPSASPAPPEWLSERAAEVFLGLVSILAGMGLASSADTHALAMLASRLEEIEICTAVIEDCGRTYSTTATSGDKLVRGRPEVAMRNEAMRHAQSLLAEFGLTPATRSKVSAGVRDEDNPFAQFGL